MIRQMYDPFFCARIMNELIGKTPFSRLLLPVIGAIVTSRFLPDSRFLPAGLSLVGLLFIFLSFIHDEHHQFTHRWFFGAGTLLFLFALTLLQYREQVSRTEYRFTGTPHTCLALLLEIPEQKPRTLACPVRIVSPNAEKVMLYLQKSDPAAALQPGDEIIFRSKLEPFRNFGNPGEWDYAGYMRNRGFAARGFIATGEWEMTGRRMRSPYLMAQRCRINVLRFYRSLGLEDDTYAFIAAVTLGYKAYLSDDIKEAFRASGTAHLLAVSGLHTGVIYLLLSLLLSFLGNRGTGFLIRQWVIILMLWSYAFLAGLSPSVIRAVIMLSLNCVARMKRMKGFSTNTLAAAALLILIFHPASLFDISFQMSFGAVFSILWFQPRLATLFRPVKRAASYIWNLMTLSLSAQLGLFPLVLYYFGSFPTWFFLSNLLLVPLMGVIIYSLVPLLLTGWLHGYHTMVPDWLPHLFRQLVQWFTTAMISIVQFMESLPLAQLTGLHISLPATILLLLFIFLFSQIVTTHRSRPLILALSALFSFQLLCLHRQLPTTAPQLVIFNSSSSSDISLFTAQTRHTIEVPDNGLLPHPHKTILRLSDGSFDHFTTVDTFPVDILILSRYGYFNTEELCRLFHPSLIILDSSVPHHAATRITNMCLARGTRVHDVRQKGAYSLNF